MIKLKKEIKIGQDGGIYGQTDYFFNEVFRRGKIVL